MAGDAVFVDTNVLLTATIPERALHQKAIMVLDRWPRRKIPLWVSSQVLREYLVVATRPMEVNGLALGVEEALGNIAQFQQRLVLLDERTAVFDRLQTLVQEFDCTGKQIHDANLVATALVHGAGSILTINVGHFQRFAPLIQVTALAEQA